MIWGEKNNIATCETPIGKVTVTRKDVGCYKIKLDKSKIGESSCIGVAKIKAELYLTQKNEELYLFLKK